MGGFSLIVSALRESQEFLRLATLEVIIKSYLSLKNAMGKRLFERQDTKVVVLKAGESCVFSLWDTAILAHLFCRLSQSQ